MRYLLSLHSSRLPDSIGNKALNLHRLWKKKFRIPKTYVCTWNAFLDYQHQDPSALKKLAQEVARMIDPGRNYAVRSSANFEDSADRSFAGQFTSLLNVHGINEVVWAVQSVWDCAHSEENKMYLQRSLRPPDQLRMGVIIQEMVSPVLSGVAFSRNPVTGTDEIVVEAVQGQGDQLVQLGVTPQRWVSRWGVMLEKPDGEQPFCEVIEQVMEQARRMKDMFRRDLDLEWVYDGRSLYWVQLRDITALEEVNVYSNQLAREMVPGLIKPMVWSIAIPVQIREKLRILRELGGEVSVEPESLVKAFYYRAYFNMGQFGRVFESLGMPRDVLERMMGVLPPGVPRPKMRPGLWMLAKAPGLAGFAWGKLSFARQAAREYPAFQAEAQALASALNARAAPVELLKQVDQVAQLMEKISYNSILCVVLMQVYNGLIRKALAARGIDFHQFDLTDEWDQLQAFDPNPALLSLHKQYRRLEPRLQERLRRDGIIAMEKEAALSPFHADFRRFLERFGHMSDSTVDFTSVPWRETPDLILRVVVELGGRETKQAPKISLQDLHDRGIKFRYFTFLFRRARIFRLYREMYSSLYTLSLMLLRDTLHALGQRLVEEGKLAAWEEIFMLYLPELSAWANGDAEGNDFQFLAENRSAEMEASRDAIIPDTIYGDVIPPLVSPDCKMMSGTPTSRGYYAGPVKVVRGLNEFGKLQPGDVLVIPYSDVSWTPLFVSAGAVIAESGGILSHSSIIAREYAIPAVVSVAGVTNLRDGTMVEVDGTKGLIYLQNNPNTINWNTEGAFHAGSASS